MDQICGHPKPLELVLFMGLNRSTSQEEINAQTPKAPHNCQKYCLQKEEGLRVLLSVLPLMLKSSQDLWIVTEKSSISIEEREEKYFVGGLMHCIP